jgi:hypothetical protein
MAAILPNARVLSVNGNIITIETDASGKEIFDAEAKLRQRTNVMYELMCARLQDQNKLRVKLAKFRGIGGAT